MIIVCICASPKPNIITPLEVNMAQQKCHMIYRGAPNDLFDVESKMVLPKMFRKHRNGFVFTLSG